MRIRLIQAKTIRLFAELCPESRVGLEEWLAKIKVANWKIPDDINSTFNSADILGRGSSRVIFNISGNRFRMICKYAFGANQVHLFVCWIGAHTEYDKVCKENKQYTVNLY